MASCSEDACIETQGLDYAKFALNAVNGSMVVEVLLCPLHIATLEMGPSGQYIFIRKRLREDGFLK